VMATLKFTYFVFRLLECFVKNNRATSLVAICLFHTNVRYLIKNIYDECGVYQLTCLTCNMKYTRQTSGPFKTRFQEHLQDFEYGSNKPKFGQHLLDNSHAIGPMNSIMDTVYITNKGKMMDTIERYIFRETKNNNLINDKLTVKPNAIFDVIVHEDPYR